MARVLAHATANSEIWFLNIGDIMPVSEESRRLTWFF
jgi:hypothetical protein